MHVQRIQLVCLAVQNLADGFQAKAKFAEKQDPLKTQQFRLRVVAVAVVPGVGRRQLPHLVVMPEGPGRDPAQLHQFGGGPAPEFFLLHASSVEVDATSTSSLHK